MNVSVCRCLTAGSQGCSEEDFVAESQYFVATLKAHASVAVCLRMLLICSGSGDHLVIGS